MQILTKIDFSEGNLGSINYLSCYANMSCSLMEAHSLEN